MGDTKENNTIIKNGVIVTMNARKVKNESTMFYLKAKRFPPEGSSPQEANTNLPAEDKIQYDNDERENWRSNMVLPKYMDINVVHQYSNLGENCYV